MTPQEFAAEWKRSPMVRFSGEELAARGLPDSAVRLLSECGLPRNAEPWLSFVDFSKTDTGDSLLPELSGRLPIGYLAGGSMICLSASDGRVVIVDRDDPDEVWTLNSSLEALYESIALYDEFISEVNRRNPSFASDYRLPEGMLAGLERDLTECDPEAMENQGFWYCEVRALDD